MSLVIVRATGLVTVQDLGRPGHMHEGLAPGGALVRGMLVAANRAVGNPDGAAAIEVLGELIARAEVELETSAGPVRAGAELAIESGGARVAYLAVRGGIDAPLVLGGRGTQPSAGIGHRLRAGDRLACARVPRIAAPRAMVRTASRAICVLPGPDLDAFEPHALASLASAPFRVLPTSDRVGTRLAGPIVPRRAGEAASRPMVRGAIEVPADGQPIVRGPEHPTTGGYPIVGVVAHDDLDRLFAVRVGGSVRFEVGHEGTRE